MLIVRNLLRYAVSFYPDDLRRQAEREIPKLAIQSGRLALEVMDAEASGVRYSNAVVNPNYPLMGRMHFGLADTLRWRVPEELVPAVRKLLGHAAAGDFDPMRQILFAVGARKHDPEAAACRFSLWNAVYLNVLVLTEFKPGIEVSGVLDEATDLAETILCELLTVPEIYEDDMRPLDMLVAETFRRMNIASTAKLRDLLAGPVGELEKFLRATEARGAVRKLEAKDAAMFWPGRSREPLGSVRTVDRYPWHYKSVADLEKKRSLFLQEIRENGERDATGDRLIDMVRQFASEVM
jgi:hypothetical protein